MTSTSSQGHPNPSSIRPLARLITRLEAGDPGAEAELASLKSAGRQSVVLGVTGSPGSGKSTLVNTLIAQLRSRGLTVGVLAVDPSSPFSGGAILGDRIRMLRHHADTGVFVRSLASRGTLGGLSARAMGVLAAMEAYGFDWLILETVGVGQSEVDIARVADHTALVLTPAGGDGVQAFKAGIMEIADVLVVNKADLPGAERVVRELRAAQGLGPMSESSWLAPIVKTVAAQDSGVEALIEAVEQHRAWLGAAGLHERRLARARFEVRALVQDRVARRLAAAEDRILTEVAQGQRTAGEAAELLLRDLGR